MKKSNIFQITPQMKTYNEMKSEWKTFIMNMQKSNFRSEVVNTDAFGLRFNNQQFKNSVFDNEKKIDQKKIGVIVGSSAAFGIGATKDDFTISSIMSKNSDFHYYNLGGRAYCGFQEIILFNSLMGQMKNLNQIIIFSGVNDIFMNNYIAVYDRILGPMFFTNYFKKAVELYSLGWKKKLLQFFKDKFLLSRPLKQKIIDNKFENIKEIIKRNIYCWSTIKKGKNIKLVYFLQPMTNWCKREISDEEQSLFKELDRIDSSSNNTLRSLDNDLYLKYKFFLKHLCADLDIEFYDCNDYFSQARFNKKWLFVDRVHLTDLGYNYISEYIKSKI